MNTDLTIFNGEMSDVVFAMEKAVMSAVRNVVAGIANHKLTVPFFVTIQSRGKHNAYGWVTSEKVWHKTVNGQDMALAYELNICSETLNRPCDETFLTIVHELVHLWALEKGIKDTSRRGQYHNDEFAKLCEDFGIKCEKGDNVNGQKKDGYHTHFPMSEQSRDLWEAFKQWKEDMQSELHLLSINTVEESPAPAKAKKKSNQIKLVCPNCSNSVRSTKKLSLLCGDCYKATKEIFEMVAEESATTESAPAPAKEELPITEELPMVADSIPAEESAPAKEEETVAPAPAKAKRVRKAKAKAEESAPAKEEETVAPAKPKKTRKAKTPAKAEESAPATTESVIPAEESAN